MVVNYLMDRDEEEFLYENEDTENDKKYLAELLGDVCNACFAEKSNF